jgi:hypothetical protein
MKPPLALWISLKWKHDWTGSLTADRNMAFAVSAAWLILRGGNPAISSLFPIA